MGHTVQETNDNCTVSKCSMVTQGYFQDEYIKFLVPKAKRRCPLINIGYYVRAVVVEEGIAWFLNDTKNLESQIVSLGAGFDTTYFRLALKFQNITYFEVDLKDVVEQKTQRIKESNFLFKKLKNVRDTPTGLLSDNYCLIAEDISDVSSLQKSLIEAGLKTDKPTLFLSECAITYMKEERSRDIISWASVFPNVVFMIYEQIYPDDGFSEAMLKHYDNLNLPLWSVEVYRTKGDQINRYKSCGYEAGWSVGAFEIYKKLLSCEAHEVVLSKEPFDEWEEWHLTSSHYTLSIGTKGIFSKLFSPLMSSFLDTKSYAVVGSSCEWEVQADLSLQFFGHCAIEIWRSSAILVIGGFGLSRDNIHMRLKHFCLISLPDMKVSYITPPDIDGVTWDCVHHACSVTSDSPQSTEFLLFGGRMSPLKSSNDEPVIISISRNANKIEIFGRKLTISNLIRPRRRHTATKIGDSTFIFGGIWTDGGSKEQTVFGDAWLLTNKETLIKLESKAPPRFSHSAASSNGIIYIVGGLGDKSVHYGSLGDIWTYNVADKLWTEIEIQIIPRYSHTCHFVGNSLFLVGGVNELSEKQPGLSIINVSDLNVLEYKLPGSSRDQPVMLHNHATVVSPNRNGILVIGGGGHCFSFGTYFNKNPVLIKFPIDFTSS